MFVTAKWCHVDYKSMSAPPSNDDASDQMPYSLDRQGVIQCSIECMVELVDIGRRQQVQTTHDTF